MSTVRDDATSTLSVPPPPAANMLSWARTWLFRLTEFGAVQVLVQFCLALAGLIVVRNLPKQDYALFAITNSMLTTGNLLADLGVGIGMRAIGGRHWQDSERFGQFLAAALRLRRRFAIASLALTLPVAAWLLVRNGAGVPLVVGLGCCIVAGVVPLLGSLVYVGSLQLHAQYRKIQQLDLGVATFRLILIGGLALTRLNAMGAAAIGVLGNWLHFTFARRWARNHANMAAAPHPADERELLSLSLKSLPNAVFFCFQGQVTMLVLSVFGNTDGVADITALGRVAAIFSVFSVTLSNVLVPRFARCQEATRLGRLYALVLGATVALMLGVLGFAALFPTPLLWLLGSKYAGLESELPWVVSAVCVGQIAGAMWGLNSSKAWIRMQVPGFIPALLGMQVFAALTLDLHSFHDVVIFNLLSAAAPLPIYAIDVWLGLRAAHRASRSS